ncbi:MAG: PilZ domain-containing protein [Acidobacteria bacterium]|nr:PilZ domain-containing protein [Acidobacteriota bacterium]
MTCTKTATVDRPLRVQVPLLVSFESESFTVRDFTLDLSVGGIFLLTDHVCPWGTVGTIKFRSSQFEEPFTISGRVVRVVSEAELAAGKPPGLGIEFLDLVDELKQKLEDLVGGVRSGSVVEAIRKSVREGQRTLDQDLRNRPADQKVMLATVANSEEIRALIRDANPTVMVRLLSSPRLTPTHLMQMLRNRNLPTRVLSAICRTLASRSNEEARWLFVTHPSAMFSEVVAEMNKLNRVKLLQLSREPDLRESVRMKACEMTGQTAGCR